jgi:HlyD family secretion protein
MKVGKQWIGIVLVVAVVALPFAIKKARGGQGLEVEFAQAQAQQVRPSILASGTLAYRNEVNLTAEVVARVAEVFVAEGQTVEAGQLLLRLDPETYNQAIDREEAGYRQNEIAIARERAALALREQQFQRTKALAEQKLVDRNSFEESRFRLEEARAGLRTNEEALLRSRAVVGEAKQQRAKTEIRAPISGRIVAMPIKIGETAIPSNSSLAGSQLMKIADTSAIQAELKVDEADIAKVLVGQKVDIYAAAYPDAALKGDVEQIALAPTIEGQSRAYKVTVRIVPPKGLQLRSGMTARADIYLGDGRPRLAVPVEAVISETGDDDKPRHFVWRERNGKAQKVEVTLGISDDRWQEVLSGLAAKDRIIVGPGKTLRTLADGAAVKEKATGSDSAESDGDDADEGDAS